MGNWNEAIIDEEVTTEEQARELAAVIVAWLAEEQIIEDRQCDCCLGDGACYPPGRRFMQACGGSENDVQRELCGLLAGCGQWHAGSREPMGHCQYAGRVRSGPVSRMRSSNAHR